MEPGKCYVLFIPPSWLVAGTVRSVEGDVVTLDSVVHLESVASGHATVSAVATARSPKDWATAISQAWAWPGGTQVLRSAILIAVPCVADAGELFRRASAADAVRGA